MQQLTFKSQIFGLAPLQKCVGDFVVQILEDFAGDFPGGLFWALFPTKMRRKNPVLIFVLFSHSLSTSFSLCLLFFLPHALIQYSNSLYYQTVCLRSTHIQRWSIVECTKRGHLSYNLQRETWRRYPLEHVGRYNPATQANTVRENASLAQIAWARGSL